MGGEEEPADRTDGGGAKTRQVTLTQGGRGGPVHTSWDRLGGFRWCSGTYR